MSWWLEQLCTTGTCFFNSAHNVRETLSAVDSTETPACLKYWDFYSLKLLHGKKRSGKHTHTLCNPMDCSMPGFLVLHQLLEFAQTHVNCVSDDISSVNPFLSCLQSFRMFSNELAPCIKWPKYWSFSFSISPTNEYSGLISIEIHWFDLLSVQGTLKSLL